MGATICMAWVRDAQTAEVAKRGADAAGVRLETVIGGADALVEAFRSGHPVPDYLLLDFGPGDTQALAQSFGGRLNGLPLDGVEWLMIGDRSDIEFYKWMKDGVGAAEYFVAPLAPEQFAAALKKVEKARIDRGQALDSSRFVAVTSARGGNGASFVASNLAYGLALKHRTLLVDCDPNSGVQFRRFDVGATPDFRRLLSEPSDLDRAALERAVRDVKAPGLPEGNLALLSNQEDFSAPVMVKETALPALAAQAQKSFARIVFDVDWKVYRTGRDALRMSGVHITVAALTVDSYDVTQRLYALSAQQATGARRLLVLNKIGEHVHGCPTAGDFAAKLGIPEADVITVPYDKKRIERAFVRGEQLLLDASPVGEALRRVVAAVPGSDFAVPKKSWLASIFD